MMNQQEIFRKLGTILDELNEQYAYLAESPEKLGGLEVELFLANANFLADHAAIIKKLNEKSAHQPAAVAPAGDFQPSAETAIGTEPGAAVVEAPVQPVATAETTEAETAPARPEFDRDIFKPDDSHQSFEFIINERTEPANWSDAEIEAPLAENEERLEQIAGAEEDEARVDITSVRVPEGWNEDAVAADDEDEIGPEPFLVSTNDVAPHAWPEQDEPLKGGTINEDQAGTWPVQSAPAKGPVSEPGTMSRQQVPVNEAPDEPVYAAQNPVHPAAPLQVEQLAAEEKKLNINELFARNREAGEKQQEGGQAPIADLKQAISLNDKLLFIRELFNGYNLAYSEAIDLVNKMNGFDAADSFLQKNYAAKNNWAAKQLTVDKLYELLRRRFPA
ncbi:hypothetical protein C7T94_16255 [Pedobacter yulinensis]|uniref:Uncharacterized protein n=1 Tax=Pedobacter yulinensis TaxID=2126353 RepID=A0A2T3HIS4_9SPHI|nr:hypothetical protein [Pedobacter yulinensis]PST82332.1 hypothetical protein C7T94_16255 [Pedobacter yulinensis]